MMTSILEIKNIGKAYRNYGNEWRRILSWFGLNFRPINENWTLQNINFSLSAGEAVGIIGQNGAGKSTLLKIITGTLKPTQGQVIHHGRIAAILELGMGFHPDLTGRQNAYHSAGLMGYTQSQMDLVIDEIAAFAEIGEYFDKPVRLYSSGMQMRVAFSVATAFRPEILIIDEALSVGDIYFQQKSFARIREFKEQGTTLLFVSHDESAIQTICNRAILLEQGKIVLDSTPEETLDYYKALIAHKQNGVINVRTMEDGRVQTISGSGEARIEAVKLRNEDGEVTDIFKVGETFTIEVLVNVSENIDSLVFGFSVKDRLGQILYGTNTWHTEQIITNAKKCTYYKFTVACDMHLGVGNYSIQMALHDAETHLNKNYEWIDMITMFSVINEKKEYFIGLSWLNPTIRIERVEKNC
ncbi:ABC transporter ATP-binding protein [Sulfurospirillum sp. 'SP']|nr:ABC transporter ATP-binding protein [Sulfurospirillum sp. 'SP']WNZ00220.1 ABC transporter ATP-binding protein [Sulfurospirillum sp. 'SP']